MRRHSVLDLDSAEKDTGSEGRDLSSKNLEIRRSQEDLWQALVGYRCESMLAVVRD